MYKLNLSNNTLKACFLAATSLFSFNAFSSVPALTGPVFPAPGGTTFSGSGQQGNTGGRIWNYSGFDTSKFSSLYWGPSITSLPSASLDGTLHSLTFAGISGTTATWSGSTSYTNPTSNFTSTVNLYLTISVNGLGANPWVPASSLGLPTAGALVNNSSGADFSAKIQFTGYGTSANVGTPLNSFQQPPTPPPVLSKTITSFSGAFYYVSPVPEPEEWAMMMLGFPLMGWVARSKQAANVVAIA